MSGSNLGRWKRIGSLLCLAAVAACDSAGKPDSPKSIVALHQAVTAKDLAAVQGLLKNGVDPAASTSQGFSALKAALLAVTGPERDKGFGAKRWDEADPGLRVMREVMAAVRRKSGHAYDETGVLQLQMQQGPFDPNRGRSMRVSIRLVTASGESGELAMARWETELAGVERPDGWNPVLRPGGTYRVQGAVKGDAVEVERIELKSPPAGSDRMTVPILTYLPSTVEQMQALTWIGQVFK